MKIHRIYTGLYLGAYAPLTSTGNIMVNGVLTSCYAFISSWFGSHGNETYWMVSTNNTGSICWGWWNFSFHQSQQGHWKMDTTIWTVSAKLISNFEMTKPQEICNSFRSDF